MSAVSRGNAAERYVARWLQDRGWLVASRRHTGGAGDLLATWTHFHETTMELEGAGLIEVRAGAVWLIEVKAAKELWQQFRCSEREEMRKVPLLPGSQRFVVNVRGSGEKRELIWVAEKDWP